MAIKQETQQYLPAHTNKELVSLATNWDKIERLNHPIIRNHDLVQPIYGYRVPIPQLSEAVPNTHKELQRFIEQDIFKPIGIKVAYNHQTKIMRVTSLENRQTLIISGSPNSHYTGVSLGYESHLTAGLRAVLTGLMVAQPHEFPTIADHGLLTGYYYQDQPEGTIVRKGHHCAYLALPGRVFQESGLPPPFAEMDEQTLYLYDTDIFPLGDNHDFKKTISPVAFLGYDLQATS